MAAGDVKQEYASSSAALTITLASLASSATLVAGRESAAVDNTTNKFTDYLLGGKITTGTSPTAGKIEVWVYGSLNDTPLYPDVMDGTDSDETCTTADIKSSSMALAASMDTDATSDQAYWMKPVSVAALFGGVMPKHWGVFVTHSTVAVLNATGTNHALYHTGIYHTVAQ